MEKTDSKCGTKVNGHIVLLCTGFLQRNHGQVDSVWKKPLRAVEARRWLHEREPRMHGVKGPSTDKPTDNIFAPHRLCRVNEPDYLLSGGRLLIIRGGFFLGAFSASGVLMQQPDRSPAQLRF